MEQKEAFKYPVAERALKKWSKLNLEILSRADDAVHYRYIFQGSTCNDGGTDFKAHLHAVINPSVAEVRIQKAWIEIPEEEKVYASKMCAVPGQSPEKADAFYEKLGKEASFVGKSLDEAVLEEVPLNYAGCFCSAPIINQKWKMVLSTIRYSLNNEPEEL